MREARGLLVLPALLCVAALRQSYAEEPARPDAQIEFDPAHAERMKEGLDVFKAKVRQVLIDTCVDCHGGAEVESGLDLATRKGLLRGGAHGPAVVVGKAMDSNVVRFIMHREQPYMPHEMDKLPDDAIAAIARWIDLGAPYDKPLVENPRDPDSWTATLVDAQAREFWSFQPLGDHRPPAVKNAAWVKTRIDAFVLAAAEAHGLTPNGAAEKRVLIRRAYFDLIGLPPKPAEVEAFANDADPQAYEKLLDRLLENPHYGERWGRHWLDAARFAESHGFEQDYDRPYAFHFRDFVIKALNQDMPYDQFVRWQLAGDEFEPENPLALMATGFLGCGVFPTQITANEVERTRYDALDDMAATTGSAMLGLSIGCARCHDHKFDPIPQADYYRFLSTFTTTVRSNLDVDMEPAKTKAALAAWEKEHAPKAAALKAYEDGPMKDEFARWLDGEFTLGNEWSAQTDWVVFDRVEAKSKNGATLSVQDDGTIVASGKNPDTDTYVIVAPRLYRQRAIRLEVLPDPSLPKQGPGRADNGNFALSRIRLFAEREDGSKRREVKLINPQAVFQQNDSSLSIASALDDDPKTGWAVDPQFGERHAAVFEIDQTVTRPGDLQGLRLVFELDFQVNVRHSIGKLRLSYLWDERENLLDEQRVSRKDSLIMALLAIAGHGSTTLPVLEEEHKQALLEEFKRQDKRWKELNGAVQKSLAAKPQPSLAKVQVCSEGVTPIRHNTQGADFFEQTHFLKRGDCDQKMGVASQGFLQVLMTAPEKVNRWQEKPPAGSKVSYRRRSLANWITDTEHGAGHLLARVIVNRLWQHHFGEGIVATANDFGAQGQKPTHPELLDWLAAELIRGGWKLKPLHKLIMTSSAYVQTAAFDEADAIIDPENTYLWRWQPRRLEAEIVRDNMLFVSGTLDETMFGPGTLDEAHKRRSIYFMVKRSKLVPMMQLFDQPEPLVSVGDRPSTTIAPQALFFINNAQVREYAHHFAKKLLPSYEKSPQEAVKTGYLTSIGRVPDEPELADAVAFLLSQAESYAAGGKDAGASRELALADFCQVLFGLNEFVYVE
ncbi:MAG TPA: PSD1 and planctomycete cytochrome C domain-containing protein [Pirellulaceae bacterium]|nr:PSD1 and planctomycete cytochrome C domain-containing protein [Pirellulaceae bacterium]